MKTLAILFAGVTVTWAVPASACDARTRAMAEEAHVLAAQLAAAVSPYAPYGADWSCIARDAMRADAAAEAVLCALDRGDYCEARDAADGLHDLAEDLQEDVEDLDFRPGRWRGPCRCTRGGLARLADRLEDLSDDLRRATKRLDEGYYAGPVGGGGFCGTPVPPSSPYVVPGHVSPAPGPIYEGSWPRGTQDGIEGSYDGSIGPKFVTPPPESFGTSPTSFPGHYESYESFRVEGVSRGHKASVRIEGARTGGPKFGLPPGHAPKFDRHTAGPAYMRR